LIPVYSILFNGHHPMLLTLDLGNTNLTIGLYEGEKLAWHWRLATDHARMPDEYGLQLLGLLQHAGHNVADLTGVALSSVVPPLTGRLLQACQQYLRQEPLVVDTGVKTGIRVRYEDPKAVGADRICDAAAVVELYGAPACVVDFGTATTFNAISREGDYLGGAITAGINLAADALFSHTAKLARIDLQRPPSVIGRNTVHAMQSGLIFGYVSMVEGMVERFRTELGPDMKVIATGGLAELVAKETATIQIIAPWLTLDGLRIIWELNQPKDK
jgi:type III pantothenate kinase